MKSKEQLTHEFIEMRAVEEQARDLYANIADDDMITNEHAKAVFSALAKDEQRHTDIVSRILQQIKNNL